MLTLGIDDAGRGPLIGPMIIAGVLLTTAQEAQLKKEKVSDSKLVVHKERVKLAVFIKKNSLAYKVVKTFPQEIDAALGAGTNLNTLEAIKIADVINALNTREYKKEKIHVIVDCPSTNIAAWQKTLTSFLADKENLIISCAHKAAFSHVSAAAGSILAKTTREEEVEKIKKEFGDIGSGYPSDPQTIDFLKTHVSRLKDSGLFRKSWATWKAIFPDDAVISGGKGQKKLGEF